MLSNKHSKKKLSNLLKHNLKKKISRAVSLARHAPLNTSFTLLRTAKSIGMVILGQSKGMPSPIDTLGQKPTPTLDLRHPLRTG